MDVIVDFFRQASIPELLASFFGLAYTLLAAKGQRICWIASGLSGALSIALLIDAKLPVAAAQQFYWIVMSIYGFYSWSNDKADGTEIHVARLALWQSLLTLGVITLVAALLDEPLAVYTGAAWPFLDLLSTSATVVALWLAVRRKIDTWYFWLLSYGVTAFLLTMQGLHFFAIVFVVGFGLALKGLFAWRAMRKEQREAAAGNYGILSDVGSSEGTAA